MSKPGYNKGLGNLKKVIFHHPNTDETFEYIPPPPQPKKTKAKNNVKLNPQTNHQEMKQAQQIDLDCFDYKENTQTIVDFSSEIIYPEPELYNFQGDSVLDDMFFNDDSYFIENYSMDTPLF